LLVIQITEVDGVEVVACEPATAEHPNPNIGGMITYEAILHLLLKNGNELHACGKCGDVFDTIPGVIGHQKIHSERPPAPLSGDKLDVIKAALRAVKKYSNFYDRYQRAAAELNRSGKRTLLGREWTTESVGRIWREYHDKVTVRTPRLPKPPSDDAQSTVSTPTHGAAVSEETSSLDDLRRKLDVALTLTGDVARGLDALGDSTRRLSDVLLDLQYLASSDDLGVIDPDVVEKARKFDDLKGLFN
jgi:hypothetical protein